MRTLLLPIFLILTTSIFSQSSLTDKEAIKNLIIQEGEFYKTGNFEAWKNCFDQENYNSTLFIGPATRHNFSYAETFQDGVLSNKEFLISGSSDQVKIYDKFDWDIQVSGNLATATCKQNTAWNKFKYETLEYRTLKKINGEWKLTTLVTAMHRNSNPVLNRAQPDSKVLLLTIPVKKGMADEFEIWVNEVMRPAAYYSPRENDALIYFSARLMRGTDTNNADTFYWLMDPLLPQLNYDIEAMLLASLGEKEGKKEHEKYLSFLAGEVKGMGMVEK